MGGFGSTVIAFSGIGSMESFLARTDASTKHRSQRDDRNSWPNQRSQSPLGQPLQKYWRRTFVRTLARPGVDSLDASAHPDDIRMAAYLGALEQIRTGTTCSLNHVVNVNSAETMAAMIEPVLRVGIRQLVTKEVRNTPDPRFRRLTLHFQIRVH